jgi:hypothetical protein
VALPLPHSRQAIVVSDPPLPNLHAHLPHTPPNELSLHAHSVPPSGPHSHQLPPTTEASDFIEKEENNAKLQDETGALRAKIEALDNKLQEVLEEK